MNKASTKLKIWRFRDDFVILCVRNKNLFDPRAMLILTYALCAKRLVTQMLARGICFAGDRTSVYTRCNEIITNALRLTDLKRFIFMITVVFKPL